MKAVIMAGGRGTRLEPYTSVLPKPLLPVGDRAILEVVLTQLAEAGFKDVTLCVGYLSHLIRAVLNDGGGHGVRVRYVNESTPLGTVGPLRQIEHLDEPFLVMNGDVLTTIDYAKLLEHHRESGNVLTIAAHRRTSQVDYGVMHLSNNGHGAVVSAFEEKPKISWVVSMGIYVFEPVTLEHIPAGRPFDFPDLVQALLEANRPVGAFLHDGLWLDIGRHEDYRQAAELWERVSAGEASTAHEHEDLL
jgi:NDP-sugar pyrophosphorylase family protein